MICTGQTNKVKDLIQVQKKRSSAYTSNLFKDLAEIHTGERQKLEKLTLMKLSLLMDEDEPKIVKRRLRRAETDTSELLPRTVEELRVQMRL